MKRHSEIKKYWSYKHRYLLAALILMVIAAFIAIYNLWLVPSGLSTAEITSATRSGHFDVIGLMFNLPKNLEYLISLPWTLLQSASLNLLGPSILAMRLPAAMLMLLATLLIGLSVKRLATPLAAVLSTMVVISSGFFVAISHAGTATAMTLFLMSAILASGTTTITTTGRRQQVAACLLIIALGLLSYMPAGPYIILTLATVALVHPRLRLEIFSHKKRSAVLIGLYTLCVLPLIIGIVTGAVMHNNVIVNELWVLGRPSWDNLLAAGAGLIWATPDIHNGLVAPVISVADGLIALLGLGIVIRDRLSVRSNLIMAMILAVIVMSIFEPSIISLLFLPIVAMETIALCWLVRRWYSLFPVNPYARSFAVIPLAIAITSINLTNLSRYFNSVNYAQTVVKNYDLSYQLTYDLVADNKPAVILVGHNHQLFELLADKYTGISVGSNLNQFAGEDNNRVIIVSATKPKTPENYELSRIMAGWHANNQTNIWVYNHK